MNAKEFRHKFLDEYKPSLFAFVLGQGDLETRDIAMLEKYAAMKLEEYKQENELVKSGVSVSACSKCKREVELDICSRCYWNSVYDYS